MSYFDNLRVVPWEPKFHWSKSIEECANAINRPHADYPSRIYDTERALIHLRKFKSQDIITTLNLFTIHMILFPNDKFKGKYRTSRVQIDNYLPTDPENINKYMSELSFRYSSLNMCYLSNIKDWYYDFETIHPFLDGNGRVGGVVIALLSNIFSAKNQYLTPGQ